MLIFLALFPFFSCGEASQDRDVPCDMAITGSRVTQEYEIDGVYQYLNGITAGERYVYFNPESKFFLFFNPEYSCWSISDYLDGVKGNVAWVSDDHEDPADISADWSTWRNSKWNDDGSVRVQCADDNGLLSMGADSFADNDANYAGFTKELAFLQRRKECVLDEMDLDYWSALYYCDVHPDCKGVTFDIMDQEQPTKPQTMYFKRCLHLVVNQRWRTYIKNDDTFTPAKVGMVFHNDIGEIITMFEKRPGTDEKIGDERELLAFNMVNLEVNVGSNWCFRFQNGTIFLKYSIPFTSEGVYRISKEAATNYEEIGFKENYLEETGYQWLQVYPRGPPIHTMLDTNEVGSVQTVQTYHQHWHKGEEADTSIDGDTSQEPLTLKIETMSVRPKVFVVHDMLSEDECDELIGETDGQMVRSAIVPDNRKISHKSDGGKFDARNYTKKVSDIRTSEQMWVSRNDSKMLENIYYRAGDVMKLNNDLIANDSINEALQVVYYAETQEYQDHHDYMEPIYFPNHEHINAGWNRFATFLIYLSPPEEGGGTSFPFAEAGSDFKIDPPKKGSAVLFYSMREDGNLDYDSRHAGLPVEKGYKYIANIWIWDPWIGW